MARSAIAEPAANAIETQRRCVSGTLRTTGRAIAMRRTNSPIAAITERKTIERSATNPGVAAVSEIAGITNLGGGPGFGPTAKGTRARTGCPWTEVTPQ